MEKIVRIVVATNLNPKKELTEKELFEYEQQYLDEVVRIKKAIESRCGREELGIEDVEILLEKILSPFEYWLRQKLACEIANKGR